MICWNREGMVNYGLLLGGIRKKEVLLHTYRSRGCKVYLLLKLMKGMDWRKDFICFSLSPFKHLDRT